MDSKITHTKGNQISIIAQCQRGGNYTERLKCGAVSLADFDTKAVYPKPPGLY